MTSARIIHGDCREVLPTITAESVCAIVTDPPYELTAARPGGRSPATVGKVMKGFMGLEWDGSGVAFDAATWVAALRVLKPGGHLLAFGGSRTFHRVAVAIEDAGFEIRDTIMWVYGSGFPKSLNLDGDHEGWGTALKPAHEPIILARKPLSERTVAANVQRWGTGALNIGACRVAGTVKGPGTTPKSSVNGARSSMAGAMDRVDYDGTSGRWPANLIHDGSDEVLAGFPNVKTGVCPAHASGTNNVYGAMAPRSSSAKAANGGDTGSAARFFYAAKASKADRAGSKHPTVKPQSLMRYLCRLVTPPGGIVLDPFAGSGSTLQAARDEGFSSIGIERSPDYVADTQSRLSVVSQGRLL